MKIVFVVIGVESLAVEFLSGYLKSCGHDVELVFDPRLFASEAIKVKKLSEYFDTKKELVKEIISKKPDIIGFSVFTLNYQRSLELAREIKSINKNIPIIFGGIHPTCVPETVIKEKCVDMLCVGEGEYAIKELLDGLAKGKKRDDIKNVWFKKGKNVVKNSCRLLIDDLDKVPFPDKELFYKIYPNFVTDDYYAISSRGCPFACTYCGNNVLRKVYKGLGRPIRQRSPKNICDELALMKERYHPKKITFADDVFVQDIKWLKNFTKDYKKRINLPYVMLTHPSLITYPIAKLLKESGCFLLMFGLQSASEKTRFKVLNRFETNDQVRKAAEYCHKAKLNFSIDHIFNIPTEGISEYEEAINFYNELRPSIINAYWLQYFPGTQIIQTAIKEGIIKKSMVKEINEGRTSTSLVVGFGGKDNFSPELIYRNFQFFFMLLPVLPKSVMDTIIEKKLYLKPFNPPIFVNIGLKFLVNLINKRAGVYFGIVKSILYFSKTSLLLKWKYR
ncbi:MAG: radical SAM protein [bacterium]|nr:radical SAM protein [bacterium]